MRNIKSIFRNLIVILISSLFISAITNDLVVIQQVSLDANNINSYFYNTGIFDQDLKTSNHPGFEWPKGTQQFAIFTAGLSCGAYVHDDLREFMCSYKGELAPGYIIDSAGTPLARTDYRFKIWKVSRTDNHINNPDWLNWGLMVPYGAPYTDVNHNGVYDALVDTPGVKCAVQTLFACLTDGFPEEHKLGEGFGGGTLPMYAEVRITAWCYDIPGLQDIQYIQWQVINKNKYLWDSTFFSIVSDPDLGSSDDDYIGCDTIRRLGFCYNGDNNDEGSYSYGINPPASGFKFLRTPKINNNYLGMTSFIAWHTHAAACEYDPDGAFGAYNFLLGLKMDRTPWMIPPGGNPSLKTKYVYSGDPETGQGWNAGPPGTVTGAVLNCGGPDSLSGDVRIIDFYGDKKMAMNSGSKNLKVNPGDTQIIVAAQLIARGSSNVNSVTKLKQLSDVAQKYYDSNYVYGICEYVIGVNINSNEIPQQYKLYQNFPNPFNPKTKIRFDVRPPLNPLIRKEGTVVLNIYDLLGKEVSTLVNEKLSPGTYEVEWNGNNYPSGVYFYQLKVNDFSETKRMVLLK
jgi:hypothetical protein